MTVLWHLFRFSWKNPVPNLPHCQCKLYVNHVGKLTETYHLCILRRSYNNILPKKNNFCDRGVSRKTVQFHHPLVGLCDTQIILFPWKEKKSLHLCSVSSASNGIHCSSVICVFFMLITHKSCLREAEEGRTGLGGVGGGGGSQWSSAARVICNGWWMSDSNK